MSIQLATLTSASSFFSPSESAGAVALIVEPKQFNAQVETSNGRKDQVIADVTTFITADDLESGNGQVKTGLKVEQTVLARELKDKVGEIAAVTVRQLAGRNGNRGAWVFDAVPAEIATKVIAYLEKREAESADVMGDLLA